MTSLWLWTGIVFFAGSSMLGSAQFGAMGGLSGLLLGLVVSLAALYAISAANPPKPAAETSGKPETRDAMRFPLINCIWGPLSAVAGAAAYEAVSAIASKSPVAVLIVPPPIYDAVASIISEPLLVPPLRVDFSLFPEMAATAGKVLSAFQAGVVIAATLALFAALIRRRSAGLRVSSIAWIPVLPAAVPYLIVLFGLVRPPQIVAVTAVTLAGLPNLIRANDESSSPAAGRILFLVLDAVYTCLIAGLAAVIAMEVVVGGTDGVGSAIVRSMQVLETARAVAAVALVWLAVAALSFAVRCGQSIVAGLTAGHRAGR
jgi:hypothetical protein